MNIIRVARSVQSTYSISHHYHFSFSHFWPDSNAVEHDKLVYRLMTIPMMLHELSCEEICVWKEENLLIIVIQDADGWKWEENESLPSHFTPETSESRHFGEQLF